MGVCGAQRTGMLNEFQEWGRSLNVNTDEGNLKDSSTGDLAMAMSHGNEGQLCGNVRELCGSCFAKWFLSSVS